MFGGRQFGNSYKFLSWASSHQRSLKRAGVSACIKHFGILCAYSLLSNALSRRQPREKSQWDWSRPEKNLWEMKASLKFSGKFSYHLSYLKWNGVKNNSTPILPLIFFGYRLKFIAKSIQWSPKCGWNPPPWEKHLFTGHKVRKQFLTFRTSVKCSLNENGPRPLFPRDVGFTLSSCAWRTCLRFVINGTLVISVHSFKISSWEGESIFGAWHVVNDVLGHSEGRFLSYTCLLSFYRPGILLYFFFSSSSSSSSFSSPFSFSLSFFSFCLKKILNISVTLFGGDELL